MKTRKRKSQAKPPSPRTRKVNVAAAAAETGIYCTECGATLENFCLSADATDLVAIRRTLAQCKKQGRFSGDFCSKLFIAHPEAVQGDDAGDDPGT